MNQKPLVPPKVPFPESEQPSESVAPIPVWYDNRQPGYVPVRVLRCYLPANVAAKVRSLAQARTLSANPDAG